MSRRYASYRPRSVFFRLTFVALLIRPDLALNAVADADALSTSSSWPNPEGRAYEAARQAAGKAYADCVRMGIRDESLSLTDARTRCAKEASDYAQYLPADKVDAALEYVANRLTTTP